MIFSVYLSFPFNLWNSWINFFETPGSLEVTCPLHPTPVIYVCLPVHTMCSQERLVRRNKKRKQPRQYYQRITRPSGASGWQGQRDLAKSAAYPYHFVLAIAKLWETEYKKQFGSTRWALIGIVSDLRLLQPGLHCVRLYSFCLPLLR